jgi:hypothetical protein
MIFKVWAQIPQIPFLLTSPGFAQSLQWENLAATLEKPRPRVVRVPTDSRLTGQQRSSLRIWQAIEMTSELRKRDRYLSTNLHNLIARQFIILLH